MRNFRYSKMIFFLYIIFAVSFLIGCNLPGIAGDSSKMDITQAYQTLNAGLTQAVAEAQTQTPSLDVSGSTATESIEFTGTATLANSPTQGLESETSTPVPGEICDQAAAANPIDITIEDDTEMEPGEIFTKIWRVVNVGTCTWTTEYQIVFFSGESMGAITSVPLPDQVQQGESVDLEVEMTAPEEPGTYQGNWKLRNTDGQLFGIGPGGESPFWVRIVVPGETLETQIPQLTPSQTLTVEVQTSGSVNLVVGDTLDLDNLILNTSGADLRYRITVIDPRHQLVPLLNVTFGVFGIEQPGLQDCQTGNLGISPIFLDEQIIGTYLCYQTDLGLPGWARLDSFDPNTGDLSLQVFTWKVP
jgi:multidrug efflux pump subunit AcrA (membrane-fusion protein)